MRSDLDIEQRQADPTARRVSNIIRGIRNRRNQALDRFRVEADPVRMFLPTERLAHEIVHGFSRDALAIKQAVTSNREEPNFFVGCSDREAE